MRSSVQELRRHKIGIHATIPGKQLTVKKTSVGGYGIRIWGFSDFCPTPLRPHEPPYGIRIWYVLRPTYSRNAPQKFYHPVPYYSVQYNFDAPSHTTPTTVNRPPYGLSNPPTESASGIFQKMLTPPTVVTPLRFVFFQSTAFFVQTKSLAPVGWSLA